MGAWVRVAWPCGRWRRGTQAARTCAVRTARWKALSSTKYESKSSESVSPPAASQPSCGVYTRPFRVRLTHIRMAVAHARGEGRVLRGRGGRCARARGTRRCARTCAVAVNTAASRYVTSARR
eukprot:5901867-Prymnesium_polylepis.1